MKTEGSSSVIYIKKRAIENGQVRICPVDEGTAALQQKPAADGKGPDGLDEDSFQREDEIIRQTDKDIRDGILYLRLLY